MHDCATIRPIRAGDYSEICDLWEAAGLPVRRQGREARDAFLRQLGNHTTTYLVAEDAGRLVGVVLGSHDQRKGWINRLAVHPGYQRRGIARGLLAACEAALGEQGIEITAALIEHGNDASIATFAAAGYVADVPVHYYRKRFRADA